MGRYYEPSRRSAPLYERKVSVRLPLDIYDRLFHIATRWNNEVGDVMPMEAEVPSVSDVIRAALMIVSYYWNDIVVLLHRRPPWTIMGTDGEEETNDDI